MSKWFLYDACTGVNPSWMIAGRLLDIPSGDGPRVNAMIATTICAGLGRQAGSDNPACRMMRRT